MTDFNEQVNFNDQANFNKQAKLNCGASSLTMDQFLKAISVTAGGSGYTSAPSVTITGGEGSGATATASITGPITGIPITNSGSGYTSASIGFSGGGGSGAEATPIINNGQIIAIRIDKGGKDYTSPPTVTITGNGSGATAQATMSVQGINITNAGSGYDPDDPDPDVTIGVPTGPAIVCNQATAYAQVKSDGKVDVLLGTFPKGSSYLTFDSSGNSADAFEVITEDGNPIFTVNKGTIIEKDLFVGGFVDSWQGALWLNHGLKGRPILSTPPLIQLLSSDVDYPSGGTLPPNPEKGQLFKHNGTKKMWNGDSWIKGPFTGKYDTLFLFKYDGITLANLYLDVLTSWHLDVKSANSVFAVTAGDNGEDQDTYLIPQNPSQGGLGLGTSEHPFKFVDTTSLFTTSIQNYQTNNPPITINSTLAFGNNPFTITSTNTITNLNADSLDGQHGSFYQNASNINAGTLNTNYIPNLDTSKITTGTFSTARIPNIFNQSLNTTNDTIFNSIMATSTVGAGFKVGLANGTTYGALAYTATNIDLVAYGRKLYLATDSGYAVEVQRNLQIGGVIKVGTASAGGDVGGQIEVTSAQPTLYAGSLALVSNTAQAAGIGGVLTFRGTYDAGGNTAAYAAIGGLKANSSAGNYEGILRFYVRTSGGALDNVMSLDRAGNLTASGQIYATGSFKTGNGNMYSDSAFGFLTNAGAAQIGSFKGIRLSTYYGDPTPPDQGIGFGADCRLVRTTTGVLSVQALAGTWSLGTINASNAFVDHINSASAGGIYIMDTLKPYSSSYIMVDGTWRVYSSATAGSTFLTNGYVGYANSANSEICNDTNGYQCLMILGNQSAGDARRVHVWDDFWVDRHCYVGVNLFVSGTQYNGNDIYIGTSVANDTHLHRAAAGVLQVLDAGGNLATYESSNIKADHWTAASGSEMYFMNHMRAYSALNIMPNANNSGNIGGNGASTNYYWGAVYANYIMYHSSHTSFDHVNDLDLVKSYTIKMDETGKSVIDDESLPFLRDGEGFFRPDRVNGFLLGCAKATAIKHDEQDDRMDALLSRIEALEHQLQAAQKQD